MSNEQRPQSAAVNEPVAPAIQQAPTIGIPVAGTGTLASTGSVHLEPYHGEFSAFQEEYVRHYIAFADTKAGFSFGIAAAVVAHHLSDNDLRTLILPPENTLSFWISAITILLLFISAFYSFLVIAPRLSSPSREGVVFFGAVAKHQSGDKYIADVARRSESEIVTARLKHCYDISRICATKYDHLRKAIWFGMPGLVGALYMLLAC